MTGIAVNSKVEVKFLKEFTTKKGIEKISFKKPVVKQYKKDGNLDVVGWFVFFCPKFDVKEGEIIKITEISSVVINRTYYNGKLCNQIVINCNIDHLEKKEEKKEKEKALKKPTIDVEDFDFDFLNDYEG